MENRRRTSFISVLIILLCISVCIGATYAYFTDSVKSDSNIIKTGKLDVTMKYADGKTDPETASWTDASTGAIFDYDLWEPGYVEVYHIKIANVGNLALKYNIVIVANGTVTELADVIDVYYFDPAVQIASRSELTDANKLGDLTKLLAGMKDTATGNLQPEEDHTITIALKMREDAGNRYQELSIGSTFSIQLHATQLDSESDAFGPDYDGDAIIPCPHIPDLWVVDVEPTEEQEGSRHATCTICGRLFNEPIPYYKSTIRFTLSNDGTYYIASGLNDTSVKDVVIPESYNDIPVKAVADNAFSGYYEITSVTIPYGVTDIGDRAFYYCNKLETVTIPYSVVTIGEEVFLYDNSLTIYCRDEAVPTDWDSNWNLLRSYYDEELGEDVNEFVPVVYSWSHGAKYTYTFVTNSEEEIDSITSAAIITLPTPYKEDYIFGGWYTDAELTKKVTSSTYHSTTEHTLYAKWMTLAECFDNPTELKLDEQKRVDIIAEGQKAYFVFTPEESGWYAFYSTSVGEDGWTDTYGYLYDSNFGLIESDDDSGNSGHFQIVCELTAGKTYYLEASFLSTSRTGSFNVMVTIPVIYTINANGGEKEYGELPQQIVSVFEITLPTLYKDGCFFGGWYETSDFTSEPLTSFNYISEENCALYARWLDLDTCRNQASEITVGEAALVDITFAGQTVFYKFKTPITDAPVYYRFSSSDIGEEEYGKSAYLYNSYADDPIDEDDSWSDNFNFSRQLEGNRTYYLAVTFYSGNVTGSFKVTVEREYTYTFVRDGSTFPERSATGIYLPNPPLYDGIFEGWYENPEFTGQVYAAGEYYFKGTDCTLYAKYLTVEELLAQGTQIENISLEELGKPYTVNITTGGQRVYFSFTVPENALNFYTFLTSGKSGAHWNIYDSTMDWVTSSYGEKLCEVYDLQAGETYYLVAGFSSVEEIGSYTIEMSVTPTYTFEVDGGVDEYGNPIENITSSTEIWLPTPTKEGSIFVGWYDNPDFNGEAMKANERYYSDTNCTLYAKWMTAEDILVQTIIPLETGRYAFANLIDGTQVNYFTFIPEFSGTYHFYLKGTGKIYDSNLCLISKGEENGANGGLDFNCYLESGETYYLFVERYSIDGYIEPEIRTFIPVATYTFDTNGGDPIENYVVTSIGTPLPTPTRADAIFLGWYNSRDELVNPYEYFNRSDCTLLAKWVTLKELEDPKYAISLGETYEIDIETAGQKVIFVFTATKDGVHVIQTGYWVKCSLYDSTLEQLACEHYGEDYRKCDLKAGKTYYLIFESNSKYNYGTSSVTVLPTIKYTFETDGGIIFDWESGTHIDSKTSADGIALPTPTKEGAIFLAWYVYDEDSNLIEGPIGAGNWYTSGTDCTLYAEWIYKQGIDEYCETNNTVLIAGTSTETKNIAAGQKIIYSFTLGEDEGGKYGFFSDSRCNAGVTLYDSALNSVDFNYDYDYNNAFSITCELEGGETYYFVVTIYYTENPFAINVTVDNGYTYNIVTNSDYEDDYTITSAAPITLWTPYNEGYTFDGWYTDAEFTQKVTSSTYYSTTKHTLYAKWIDPFTQATTMTLNETYEIQPSNQKLYYKFTPEESGNYTFSLSNANSNAYVEAYGTLYDSSKQWINSNYGENFSIYFSVDSVEESEEYETYYFVIEFWSYDEGAPITLTIEKVSE